MLKVWKRGYVLYAAGKMSNNISVDEPCDLNIFSYIFTVHSSHITFFLCLICFNSKILKLNFLNFVLYVCTVCWGYTVRYRQIGWKYYECLNAVTLKHMYSIYCTRNNQPTRFLLFSRNCCGAMSFELLLNYICGIARASSRTLFANCWWIWAQVWREIGATTVHTLQTVQVCSVHCDFYFFSLLFFIYCIEI